MDNIETNKKELLLIDFKDKYNELLDKFCKGEEWFNNSKNWKDNPKLRKEKGEQYIQAFQEIMKQIDKMINMFEKYNFEISDKELLEGIK